jgi:hypothetical protein
MLHLFRPTERPTTLPVLFFKTRWLPSRCAMFDGAAKRVTPTSHFAACVAQSILPSVFARPRGSKPLVRVLPDFAELLPRIVGAKAALFRGLIVVARVLHYEPCFVCGVHVLPLFCQAFGPFLARDAGCSTLWPLLVES